MTLFSSIASAPQPLLWFLAVFCVAAFAVSSYWLASVVANQPFRWSGLALHSVLILTETVVPKAIGMDTGIGIAAMLLYALLSAWLVFGQKRLALIILALKIFTSLLVLELVCACLMMPLIPLGLSMEQMSIVAFEDFQKAERVLCMYGFGAVAQTLLAAVLALLRYGLHLKRSNSKKRLYIKVFIRLIALTLLGSSALYIGLFRAIPSVMEGNFLELIREYNIQVVLAAGLFLVAVSYFAQDIRYIDQLRRNETLARKQATSQSLLKNLRYFRHNMINMLYGLEGVMLSGDTEDVQRYYGEMQKRCALINNENILELERVNNPAISAVLLRATNTAAEREIAFSLYVQEGTRISRHLSEGELCQILGVLLDNALEAAGETEEPSVLVELRNVDGMLELIVKNTYAGLVDKGLQEGGHSTKEGHAGVGLASCYDILRRKRDAFLHYDISRQYVCAQLLVKL